MANPITDAIDSILNNIPGVINIILSDFDGNLIYTNGRFDLMPEKYAAATAVAHNCCAHIEKILDQEFFISIAEFSNYKIYQLKIGAGGKLVITSKVNESQAGLLRIESGKIVQLLQALAQ